MPNQEVNTTQFAAQCQPPRCQHILLSGETCGQPALHGRTVCRFHRAVARRPADFVLPVVEDAASLQLALNRVLRALADDLLTYKKASLLLYGLQIAASNFKRLRDERQDVKNKVSAAEQPSLVRLLLEKFGIPDEEPADEFAAENRPITRLPDRPIEVAPLTFDIKACAEPMRHTACPERVDASGSSVSRRIRGDEIGNRQSTIGNAFLRQSRITTRKSQMALDASRQTSSNDQHV
jgi:hypothetical protein